MKKYNKWLVKFTGLYLLVSIIYNLFGRIIPVKYATPDKVDSLIYISMAGAGILLVIWDVLVNDYWRKTKYCWLLYLFLVIMAVSSVINMEYGWTDNAKTIVWSGIQFTLCYSYTLKIEKEKAFKQVSILIHTMSVIWIIPVLYSIFQFITLRYYWVEIWGKKLRQGIMEKRLFGVFNDPNFAAIICVFLIIGMYFLYHRTEKKALKVVYVMSGILQFLYIVLSGSRTVQIGMAVTVFLFVYFYFKNRNWKPIWKKSIASVTAVFLLLGTLLGTQKVCEIIPGTLTEMGLVKASATNENLISKNEQNTQNKQNTKKPGDNDVKKILEREDTGKENISNNRFQIWRSYLSGLKAHLIFGMSPRNSVQVFVNENPNSYIAQTDYETHNGYLSLLVCTGIAGFLVMLLFLLAHVKDILKYLWKKNKIEKELIVVLLLLTNILVFAFFFTDLFFVNDISATLFFILAGSLKYWRKEKIETC